MGSLLVHEYPIWALSAVSLSFDLNYAVAGQDLQRSVFMHAGRQDIIGQIALNIGPEFGTKHNLADSGTGVRLDSFARIFEGRSMDRRF
jgi:hypothetical protein